jgi:flagellin
MEDFTMGLRIQNNIAAMNAHRNLTLSDNMLSKSLERLSSGYRINKASDDAAGLAISQGMRADIASLKVASRNVAEASSQVQQIEGAMDQIGNILVRLKELATQAASANASSNLTQINAEATELLAEIGRIGASTSGGGTYQVGSANDDNSKITFSSSATTTTTLGINTLDLSSAGGAQTALTSVTTAVGTLSTARGSLGATQNRLAYAAANLATTIENKQAAESVIRDADMAAEMTTFTKNQILLQAGTAMLAQANMAPQSVLSLFG